MSNVPDRFIKVQQRAEAVAAKYRESQSKYYSTSYRGEEKESGHTAQGAP